MSKTETQSVSIHAPARGATPRIHAEMESMRFQSTRPHGARPHRPCTRWRRPSFNPRARTGRDVSWFVLRNGLRVFQSTRPHGARRRASRPPGRRGSFNPRARTGRDAAEGERSGGWMSFNPRARTGRDHEVPQWRPGAHVSIHAPARGATKIFPCRWVAPGVSIHAPARGATSARKLDGRIRCCFNPRARTGRDQSPAHLSPSFKGFNPRARTGRDKDRARFALSMLWFQSTRPHGARRPR